MASEVRNEVVAGALDACRAALVTLHAADLVPADVDDAKALVRDLEAIWRMTGAAQVSVLGEIARSGVHRQDGHHSAKVLVRHVGRLSDGEAGRREQVRRALADLPVVFASYRAGRIGPCQVQAIARVWANPRVRAALIDQDAAAARLAERLSYRALALQLRTWERLVDQNGAEDRARAGHEARNATAHQGFDGSWTGAWNCGALEGAVRRSILDAFERAEYEADWATARADLGDSATQADLCRTDAQRRSDALGEIFRCAADHHAAAPGGAPILTTLLIDQQTFEDELRRQTGARPAPTSTNLRIDPDDPIDPDGHLGDAARGPRDPDRPLDTDGPLDIDGERGDGQPDADRASRSQLEADGDGDGAGAGTRPGPIAPKFDVTPRTWPPASTATPASSSTRPPNRVRPTCSTLDGQPLPPAEVLAAALCGEVRRAVIGAGSVVIDLGRRQRLYTGPAAAALKLQLTTCAWPGCHVPVTHCQGDHLTPWRNGGSTSPENGAPLCGTHNRTKEQGYRITRDQLGDLHVHRPDGTEIT